jgi:RNA recognition motif-containing protein
LASIHKERLRTAGRIGTKSFVDPCKVFVGNLPYDTDDDKLGDFVLRTMGQSRLVLHASKVIYDWKTGKSKGYGFVEFVDPIYATVCLDVVNGQALGGRPVSVAQGRRKEQENQLYLEKKKKKKAAAAESDEDRAISLGLEEAANDDEEYESEELEVDGDGIAVFNHDTNEDLELDAVLFGLSAGDDEKDDGIFLEPSSQFGDIDPSLNRVQRREAARRLKRKKLPHKGFG